MNAASEKRLSLLHPALADAVRKALAMLELRGHVVEVVQGLRTFEEQDALFAQGRTKPGQIVTRAKGGESNHNYGLAADLCPFVNGKPDWNAPVQTWALIGEAAAAHGLEWGGAWQKFLDKPHVQIPSLAVKECQRLHASGGIAAVWSEATKRFSAPKAIAAPRGLAPSREMPATTEKRVTVLLHGADRHLWRGGRVQIRIADVFASGGPRALYTGETDLSTIELRLQLSFDARQVYGLTFSAPGHRPAWFLIQRDDFIRDRVERDEVILRLMLVPERPQSSDLLDGHARLVAAGSPFVAEGCGVDAGTYATLKPAEQMALLNIEAKLRESAIDGIPLLSFVRAIRHVAVDRVFLEFDAALKARMAGCADFAGAPGHPAPKSIPGLPAHPDSWKHTRFAEGNVQLSFAADTCTCADGKPGSVHSADVDIDLGRGIAHAAEWLDNNVVRPGHKTDQTLVYGLLYAQNILPCYTLDPAPATTDRSIVMLQRLPQGAPQQKRRPRRVAKPAAKRAGTRTSAGSARKPASTVRRRRAAPAVKRKGGR